jgi:hypothetical protein
MDFPFLNEEHLMELLLIANYLLIGWIYPCVHIDDELIGEPLVTEVEEVLELLLEV